MEAKKKKTELSARERQFVNLEAKGLDNRTIANRMGVTTDTITYYRRMVAKKRELAAAQGEG